MRAVLPILCAAAVLLLAGCGGAEREAPQGRPPALGFNEDLMVRALAAGDDSAATRERIAALHRRLGSTLVRLRLPWIEVEPRPGALDLSAWDRMVDAYRAHGVRPILLLGSAPAWARSRPAACRRCTSLPPTEDHLDAWGRFVGAVARHYRGRVAGIEVWNEPNLVTHWGGSPDPERYARLLCRARREVGGVPLAGFGVSNFRGGGPRGMGYRQFLRRAFAAGAGRCADAISFHPYPHDREVRGSELTDTLDAVRELRDRHAPKARLWITEVGLSNRPPWSGTDQAAVVRGAYDAARRGGVDTVLVHTLVEFGDGYGVTTLAPGGRDVRLLPAAREFARITERSRPR